MEPLKKPNVESAKQANKNTWKEKFESQEKDQEKGDFKRPSEAEFKKEKIFDKVLYCQGIGSLLADLIKRCVL